MVAISALACATLWAGSGITGAWWLAASSLLQAVVLLALSWRWGIGGTDHLDMVCLLLCGIGVVWWWLSGESLAGLSASIIVDVIAILPSLVKTIRWPYTESLWFYLLDTIAALCIMAATPWRLYDQLYPFYLLVINGLFAVIIAIPITPMYEVDKLDRLD